MLRSRTQSREMGQIDVEKKPLLSTSASWPQTHPQTSILAEDRLLSQDNRTRQHRVCVWRLSVSLVFILLAGCFIVLYSLLTRSSPISSPIPLSRQSKDYSDIQPGWRPPVVDRYIIEKLELLDLFDQHQQTRVNEADSTFTSTITSLDPMNDERCQADGQQVILLDNAAVTSPPIEAKDRGEHERFLFPSWIGEQESKARLHFVQLMQLASDLNRTLVSPRVAKGRMGTCMKYDFNFYYDTHDIANVISLEVFKARLNSRAGDATASIVHLDTKQPDHSFNAVSFGEQSLAKVYIDRFGNPSKSKHSHCLADSMPILRFRSYSPSWLVFQNQEGLSQLNQRSSVSKTLTSAEFIAAIQRDYSAENSMQSPDVLVINYELRHPIYTESESDALNYAAAWKDLGADVARHFSPFVAAHWRMETLAPEVLGACSIALVQMLKSLLSEPKFQDIEVVYLATDYPLAGDRRIRSSTFKSIGSEHLEAIDGLKNAFLGDGPLSNKTFMYLEEALHQRLGTSKKWSGILSEDMDMGVMGILDKIILSRADLFLAANEHCGKASSYTRQAVQERRNSQAGTLRNIVHTFGI